jgi:glycosyltransferase involved in cell wall biosynthesis
MVPYPLGRVPGQRYRIEQWAPLLAASGVDLRFSPFLSDAGLDVLYQEGHGGRKVREVLRGYLNRVRQMGTLKDVDVVYLFREAALLGRDWLESAVARRRPIVFDFDDAIYLTPTSEANRSVGFLKWGGKAAANCRRAARVMVGNDVLAGFAGRYASAVDVVPSTIDMDRYVLREQKAKLRPLIGWTGSVTTAPYLASLAGAFRRLRAIIDFDVRVIGAPVRFDGLDVQALPWRADTEVEDLQDVDVGLMPLWDDEWSRGKCAMKALQYMALGIPPVVSPVGASAVVVQDGVNGFHARDEDEWVDRMARLLSDADLRNRLGRAARRTVEEGYSARVQAPRVAEIFRQASRSHPGPPDAAPLVTVADE